MFILTHQSSVLWSLVIELLHIKKQIRKPVYTIFRCILRFCPWRAHCAALCFLSILYTYLNACCLCFHPILFYAERLVPRLLNYHIPVWSRMAQHTCRSTARLARPSRPLQQVSRPQHSSRVPIWKVAVCQSTAGVILSMQPLRAYKLSWSAFTSSNIIQAE